MRPRGSAGKGRPRRPVRDQARNAAFDVVRAVAERDAYANLLLPKLLRERGITGRDAALATELTYGTLRGLGTYDAIIDVCGDRAPDPVVRDALRLGAHQLLKMRVPPHAAVGTTVDLVRLRVGQGPAKFVNAVLRKIAGRTLEEWVAIVAPDPERDPAGHLSVAHSHPRWVVTAFRDALGPDSAETAEVLAADNERPLVTLVARPGRSSVKELRDAGAEPARYSPYGAYLPEGDPGQIPAVAEARAAVQDEASQLVALALTRVPLDGRDERWLDLCAGPGGKAGLLDAIATHGDLEGATPYVQDGGSGGTPDGEAGEVSGPGSGRIPAEGIGAAAGGATLIGESGESGESGGSGGSGGSGRSGESGAGGAGGRGFVRVFRGGARLVAADVQQHRARLVRQAVGEAGVVTVDGTEPAWRPGTFDRVMLDAPCTGLGALRRRPEARWRRDPSGIAELSGLQRRLLVTALEAVRPGGVVAYVTCSPHLAETRVVVGDVLARRDDVEQLDARDYLPEVGGLGDGPHAQFWPHRHGTDAMFLALLRKRP